MRYTPPRITHRPQLFKLCNYSDEPTYVYKFESEKKKHCFNITIDFFNIILRLRLICIDLINAHVSLISLQNET